MSGVYIRQHVKLAKSESICELALICDERYGINSKTAQDQSWRRETVRDASRLRQLNRLPKHLSPPLSFSKYASHRYQKELVLYRAEVVQNETKLKSITASGEGGESWEARNAVRRRQPRPFNPLPSLFKPAGESSARERKYGPRYRDSS
jgi:hypothetical protein